MNLQIVCPKCNCFLDSKFNICPHCGEKNINEKYSGYLEKDIVLNKRYQINKLIESTHLTKVYLGKDIRTQEIVVIKEIFPLDYMYRDTYNYPNLIVYNTEYIEEIVSMYKGILNEVKLQIKLSDIPGVAKTKEYFEQNNTLYIVMECIEGDNLEAYIDNNGYIINNQTMKILSMDQVREIMEPIILTLAKMHECGIVHGNITPKEMLFSQSGVLKLSGLYFDKMYHELFERDIILDFLENYRPEEQFRKNGNIGPWTDVYSLCAVIYRCITGIEPMEAIERVCKDILIKPSELGIEIDSHDEKVLMMGLEVYAYNRFSNMKALYRALYCKE